jgi:hypothetical protein
VAILCRALLVMLITYATHFAGLKLTVKATPAQPSLAFFVHLSFTFYLRQYHGRTKIPYSTHD